MKILVNNAKNALEGVVSALIKIPVLSVLLGLEELWMYPQIVVVKNSTLTIKIMMKIIVSNVPIPALIVSILKMNALIV